MGSRAGDDLKIEFTFYSGDGTAKPTVHTTGKRLRELAELIKRDPAAFNALLEKVRREREGGRL